MMNEWKNKWMNGLPVTTQIRNNSFIMNMPMRNNGFTANIHISNNSLFDEQ